MLASVLISAVIALGAAASPSISHVRRAVEGVVSRHLVERQGVTAADLPPVCRPTCETALAIYNACASGDDVTCLSVCKSDTFNEYVACFKCAIDNTPGLPTSSVSDIQTSIDQIEQICEASGTTPSVTVFIQGPSGSDNTVAGPATSSAALVTVPADTPASTPVSSVGRITAPASSATRPVAPTVEPADGSSVSAKTTQPTPSGAALQNAVGPWAIGAIGVAAGVLAF